MKKTIILICVIAVTSTTSCKKESSQHIDLKVTKVELLINSEVVSTSKPVYK